MSILESLSKGLRGAGAVMSPSVYNTQAQEMENERQRSQRNKEMVLGLLANAVEKGVMSPEDFQQRTQKMGYGNLPLGPSAQTQELTRLQEMRASRSPAMQRIFSAGKPPQVQVPNAPFTQDSIRASLAMGGGPTREADSILQQSGIREGQGEMMLDTQNVSGQKYDPRLDPAAWKKYAEDREAANDWEEVTRAYAMADKLEGQTKPELKAVDGALYQVQPESDSGSITGYSVKPLTTKEETGEAGARAKQALMIEESMIAQGASPEEAKRTGANIASGRWVRETDPQSGVTRVIDLGAPGGPRIVTQFGSQQGAQEPTSTMMPQDIEPGTAVGPGGILKSLGNRVADFVGSDIPFPETSKAEESMRNLRIQTLSTMQAAGSWRPSVFTSKLLDEVTEAPLKLFRGDQLARNRMASTRDMIQKEVDVINRTLKTGNLRPNAVSEFTQKREQLEQLRREYDVIVSAFDKGKKKPNAEDFWK